MGLRELHLVRMELKNKYRLFALGLTLCIHLAVISPFSGWLNQNLLPTLHEEGMEIELIQAENEDEKDQLPVPEEKKEELPPEDLPSDYVFKNLPKETKKLSEDLSEDKIINPFDDKPPRPDSNKDPNKTDWDLIDKILDEPLEKSSIPKAVPEKTAKKQAIKAKAEELLPEDTDSLKGEKLVNTSPLFLKPGEVFKEDNTPREIRKTFKNNRPERTNWDKLEFSMNTYKWSYERFIENWAIDINKWWVAPVDYIAGNIPQGEVYGFGFV